MGPVAIHRSRPRFSSRGALVAGGVIGALLSLAAPADPANGVELRGASYFERPPWKVDLVSYQTDVSQPSPRYYYTVELPEGAGAGLAGLSIQQTHGADTWFRISAERTRAFLGRPRREGPAVPVQTDVDDRSRRVDLRFPEPVPPGNTITVMLRPWANPSISGVYMFQVQALPAGPNPRAASLGFATLRIYRPDWH